MPRRIVISNIYADDNRGGAAITQATIDLAKRAFPNHPISLMTLLDDESIMPTAFRHTTRAHPDVELLPPILSVPRGPFGGARAIAKSLFLLAIPKGKRTRSVDAEIVIGKGGQMFSADRGVRGTAGFWLAAYPLMLASRRKVPTVLLGITIGPYRTRSLARLLGGVVLRRVSLVMVRDRNSYDQARALGVSAENLVHVPDVVMSMQPPTAEETDELTAQIGLAGARYGCLTLNRPAADGENEYVGEVVRQLFDRGVIERLALVVQTHGAHKSDLKPSEAFLAHMNDPRIILVREDFSPRELSALYSGGVFTIGGRLHSAILSLVGGTPGFPLCRRGQMKAQSLFEAFGLVDNVIAFNHPATEVAEHIAATVARGDDARHELRALVAHLREQSRNASVEYLREHSASVMPCQVMTTEAAPRRRTPDPE